MEKRALEGVKVLEFAWVGVTPSAITQLGVNGAEVVRVESTTRRDPMRTSGPYIDNKPSPEYSGEIIHIHSDKYGVTLNMKHPKALGIARKLAAWADIVADGWTTGTLEKMGLGYEELKKINPDIIMFSCNMFGQTGPLTLVPGTGVHLTGMTGFVETTGWPDRGAVSLGYYSDSVGPHIVLATVLAALDYKRRTGKGQHIDIAQCEASTYFSATPIVDWAVNNHLSQRHGNSLPYAAPHGVYRCQGDDKWCAIAVFTDDEWRSFCEVIGNPSWTRDAKFATLLARKKNEDELNRLIEEWTVKHSAREVMELMQAGGVAAGAVQNGEEVFKDPHVEHLKYFQWLYHPGIDRQFPAELDFPMLSKTPPKVLSPRPMMGEHNEYVYTKLLGIPDEEFVRLLAEGVFE